MLLLALAACAPGDVELATGKDTSAATDSAADSDDPHTGDSGHADSGDDSGGDPCGEADTGEVDGPDDDGDGFIDAAHGGDDCDDRRPNVYPRAPDPCDGLDQDCDGEAIGPGACAEVGDLAAAAWVTVQGDEDSALVEAGTPSWGGATAQTSWLQWHAAYRPDSTRRHGYLAGDELAYNPTLPPRAWRGNWGEEALHAIPAGDVDGDGVGDVWTFWIESAGGTAAYLLRFGPVPGDTCGLEYTWDWADAVVQNTQPGFDDITLRDAGADFDGDALADALITLSPREGPTQFHLLPGSRVTPGLDAEVTDTFPHATMDDDDGGFVGFPVSIPDADGDGRAELLLGSECGPDGDGSYGVALVSGADLVAAAEAAGELADVARHLCPGDTTGDWHYPWAYDPPVDRGADVDGDGYTDLLVAGAPLSGGEASISFVELQSGPEVPLEDRVLRELSTRGDSANSAANYVNATHLGPTPEEQWLGVSQTGWCLYRVADIPLYGVVEKADLPAPCFEASDGEDALEDLLDLDGDGLPEWVFSDSGYYVDGENVGRVIVVQGFDVPYDDPSRW